MRSFLLTITTNQVLSTVARMMGGLAGLMLVSAALAEPARLTVQVDRPSVKISPLLYGIFFEEINCAGDGGIYAELVRNRSFEDAEQPENWSLVTTGNAQAEMAIDTSQPLSDRNHRSLRLHIHRTQGGRAGIANAGYWGISVTRNAQYRLSLYARCANGFDGPLAISLEDGDGKKHAEADISNIGTDWRQLTTLLTARDTDPAAKLVISAGHRGTVWLDAVSLFPVETWKNRTNGLRPDLARMLDELQPSFMRFPGGCWVEGDTPATAYRWKTTIGPIEDRANQWNLWAYHSTNGLGFHEYLQMCEDLRTEPMFVINCGMSHKGNVSLDRMDEWVQDALDAIEYANGTTESTWGKRRAQAGHPAPFNLKYLEIGNENGGPAYEERYALFYDKIKARYPQMQLIANEWHGRPQTRPIEILDEHYYDNPGFFIRNADRYDHYDRKGPKVYVGEYAVTKECGDGNLRAAVGEAAFMTGLERNSDIVIMASYAPLFSNVHYKRWNPDLICFDSSRVYGTPSYHVQNMFSTNRGDVLLPVEVEAPLVQLQSPTGGIGVGTWSTQAEFKDLRVSRGEEILFESREATGLSGWKTLGNGRWELKEGALRQTSEETNVRAVTGDPSWTDYTYTLKARKLTGKEGFLILFHVADGKENRWWNLGGWGNTKHAIETPEGIVGKEVPGRIETGRWYDLRIELKGPAIRCYLDGKLVNEATIASVKPLHACASLSTASGETILKVVNVSALPQETLIDLRGLQNIGPAAKAIVLTSASPADENTLDQPNKVAPATQEIQVSATQFRHVFPANSVNVLRLKTRSR